MLKLFGRKKMQKETAPQLSLAQRRMLEVAGDTGGPLPYATLHAMEQDAMIQTALTIKKLGTIASEYEIAPANGSDSAKRNAAFAEEALERMQGSARSILTGAMDAFARGWSVQEMVFEPEGGKVWLRAVRSKDPALFGVKLSAFGALEGLTLRMPGQAEHELPIEKFIVHAHRGSYHRPKGRSDLESAYRHWQAKQRLLAAWRAHLERFASPTVMGRFDRGLADAERDAMLGQLQRLSDSTAILFPSEITIDTLGGDRDSSSGFLEAIEFHNREIARAILGQTLTTDEGRRVGSLALGRVHLQVLVLQLESLRRELADSVMTEQVLRPLIEMNFGPGLVPKFKFKSVRLEAFETGRV